MRLHEEEKDLKIAEYFRKRRKLEVFKKEVGRARRDIKRKPIIIQVGMHQKSFFHDPE